MAIKRLLSPTPLSKRAISFEIINFANDFPLKIL
jgi:hypothetical protein